MTLALLPRRDACRPRRGPRVPRAVPRRDQPRLPAAAQVAAGPGRDRPDRHLRAHRGELAFGARVAWRNAARCIGRLYWHGLHVRDRRQCAPPRPSPTSAPRTCGRHPRRPDPVHDHRVRARPARPPGPRIVNEQLVRYAGHRTRPARSAATAAGRLHRRCLGTRLAAPDPPGRFDVLPLADHVGRRRPRRCSTLPRDAVLEVPLAHPEFEWFADLGLRWHAVPAICNMSWRSAASPIRRRRSTAGTWAPRSAPATSPTPTATTCCPSSPSGWAWTPAAERHAVAGPRRWSS